jgi:hypothetical protein
MIIEQWSKNAFGVRKKPKPTMNAKAFAIIFSLFCRCLRCQRCSAFSEHANLLFRSAKPNDKTNPTPLSHQITFG